MSVTTDVMKKTLPLDKRGSQSTRRLPTERDIIACLELACTPEAADYASKQFDKIIKPLLASPRCADAERHILQSMSETLKKHAHNVHLQLGERENAWKGNATIKTDFQNLQKNLAESIAKEIPATVKESVKMDFAVSDKADLLRAFSVDGQEIDKETADKMDALLNACLADYNLISKSGAVYDADEKGNIRQDASGREIRASAEQVGQVILQLLQQFLQGKGISITTEQHAWPEQQAPTAKRVETSKPINVKANDPGGVDVTPASDEAGIGVSPSN